MAAISRGLTERGVSANVVSAFFHDHLFVPVGKEGVALEVLRELSGGGGCRGVSCGLSGFLYSCVGRLDSMSMGFKLSQCKPQVYSISNPFSRTGAIR